MNICTLIVLSKKDFKIGYASRLDRYSVSKGNEWISVPTAVFAIIVTIARSKIFRVKNNVLLKS